MTYDYAHDHLYSVAAVFGPNGGLLQGERYEYDAYGTVTVMNRLYNPQASSTIGNPYTFTGRRLDSLDPDGSGGHQLKLMYYRARTYDPQTGRFMQRDPLGINPRVDHIKNIFRPVKQYRDGGSLYQYVISSPMIYLDSDGKCLKSIGEPWLERRYAKVYSWQSKLYSNRQYAEISWQVKTHVIVDIQIGGPKKPPAAPGLPPGGGEVGPLISFDYYDWRYPTDRTFKPGLNYEGNPCRISIECKGECCSESTKNKQFVTWIPKKDRVKKSFLTYEWESWERSYVYGTLKKNGASSIGLPGLVYHCEPNNTWEAEEKRLCDKWYHDWRCGCVKSK